MAKILLSCVIICLILLLIICRDFSHGLRVSKENSDVQHGQNSNYTRIFNFWKEHRRKFNLHGKHKKVVVMMGNTGSGKTTLVSALIGRKLRVTKPVQEFSIVDEEDRIGTDASSKTLVPEAVVDDERNITYIDCSGFLDNRNVEYEISSLYLQKSMIKQVEKIKLVLVISHDSFVEEGTKDTFDHFIKHIGRFIKDIPKLHSGIGLVVTKVNSVYNKNDNGTVVLYNTEQIVLDEIANFLKAKKIKYQNETKNLEQYQNYINLIDIFLQKNNYSYPRISIFRKPVRIGLLKNMPERKNEINAIAKMIIDNLDYVEVQKNDFEFAFDPSLFNIVNQIVDDIYKNALKKHLHKIGNEILIYCLQMEKQYCDIRILREKIAHAYNLMFEVRNIHKPEELLDKVLNVATDLSISISLTNLNAISDDIKALQFFTTISNYYEVINMIVLKNETQNVIDSITSLKTFYNFLKNLQDNLAEYRLQKLKNDHRVENILISCANLVSTVAKEIPDLENIANEIGENQTYQEIKTLKLNQFQLKHLKAIFSTFTSRLEFSCTSSSESMIVTGYNVKMSEVVTSNCWAQAKEIQIYALNKVFIDQTINKTGAEAQLFIFAPTWEIVGEPKIILNGKAGEPHENAFAKSAIFISENGANGLPGLPGGSAGNFFGIGKQFIKSEFLHIYANGGKGGPGQHGGNGFDGIKGEEIPKSFFDTSQELKELKKYFDERHFTYEFVRLEEIAGGAAENPAPPAKYLDRVSVSGKPGKKPTDGGDGGAGGKGGYPGRIIINSLGNSINVTTSNITGFTGFEGQGGHGGKETSDGKNVKFDFTYGTKFMYIGWSTEFSNIEWTDGARIPAGKNGMPGYNKNNPKNPKPTSISLYSAINSFKNFVRLNLFENTKESELRAFIHELENNNQIKAQYNTLAFVQELKGLESQFLKLKMTTNFISFYNSLLSRVEEYAKSQKTLENKKVLNFIYTAAFTKRITLNERKGQIVTDLSEYLDTIENIIQRIDNAYHVQIVQQYRTNFQDILNKKIQEANNFIQNIIEPEIDKLWDESENQMKTIIDEIHENKHSIENALETLRKNRAEIRNMMVLRATLSPLKLAASFLSFTGPIGAGLGVAVIGSTSIAEGMVFDTTSKKGENKVYSLDPNLKLLSRVTEVVNNKHQRASEKLDVAMTKLEDYEKQLSISDKEKKRKIKTLRTQLQEATFRNPNGLSGPIQKLKDIEEITKKMTMFVSSEKDILEETKKKEETIKELTIEKKYEKRLRMLNDAQSVLNSVEIVFSFTKKLDNDEGMIGKISDQISTYVYQLEVSEKLEKQVYDIIIPDLCQVEETMYAMLNLKNGSSHTQLDLTKWNVRTTLKDLKSLLQKFTHKMPFELQNDLQRHMEKIDEGFSILIDIYNRIDSYSDIVKQAEYIAHIESASTDDILVTDTELNKAVNDLQLIIHSNILTEKYEIALYAFKQHYFPFAARVLQRYQLPASMRLNDTETMRSNIVNQIKDLKNYIHVSKATADIYSKHVYNGVAFDSITTGSSPFYVWKYDTIKNEIHQLLNGSEIVIKADISRGLTYNAVKYNDIGINFKLNNTSLQSGFTSVLQNFKLTMTMIGNNYYRCSERYYFISFDDNITISYIFNQNEKKQWINSNYLYSLIQNSHPFLSPYGMWSIKLQSNNESVSFNHFKKYANEIIDLQMVGQGCYIEQNANFNFEVCNEYLDTFYEVENIVKVDP